MTLILKDPASELDYEIDWGADYLDSDAIASSSWSVDPDEPGGVKVTGSSHDGQRSIVMVTGGLEGRAYRLENSIMTASARRDRRSITLRVEAR